MKIALLYGRWCLSFRKSLDFKDIRKDPRGLTGSEYGLLRIAECLAMAGHSVEIFTVSADTEHVVPKATGAKYTPTIAIRSIDDAVTIDDSYHATIAINEPDLLRMVTSRVRVCEHWVNDFTFCRVGFQDSVDIWTSPSAAHLDKVFSGDWAGVEQQPDGTSKGTYEPLKKDWHVNLLGCDPPARLGRKVPGRVIYCSSPDRGLHWLLQEWPAIKRAVPHASLKVFYRLEPWLRQFDATPFFPPIEPQRDRARYIDEALRRLKGLDVEVLDSVSRETLGAEMAQAECLAYPCDTSSWSEGFSCSILESCAYEAAPVITDCDALPSVYGDTLPIIPRGQWDTWRDTVIRVLTDDKFRDATNKRARKLAEKLTWKAHTERLLRLIDESLSRPTSGTKRAGSKTSTKRRARA